MPLARTVRANNVGAFVPGMCSRKMALGTKRHPLTRCALSATKLNSRSMNLNLLRVLIFEPLQLLLCLLVVNALTVKCRCHASFLRLQCLYLRFRLRQTVERKRKTLADYIRHRNLFEGVSGNFKQSHIV